MKLLELLAISLGVDRLHYKELFEDGCSVMRCNFYPSCQQPSLALGTGPHCDPTSLTILHQDQVGGLDVFADNMWQTVPPHPRALVVNIGDTFTVRYICIIVTNLLLAYISYFVTLWLSITVQHGLIICCNMTNPSIKSADIVWCIKIGSLCSMSDTITLCTELA